MTSKNRSDIRREKLMSKLLARVASELGRLRIPVTSLVIDEARAALTVKWSEHGGSLSDSDLRTVVQSLKASQRSATAMDTRATTLPDIMQLNRAATPAADRRAASEAPADASALLLQTTKKQRQMLADREWIEAAQRDRVNGVEGKKQEKLHHLDVMRQQKDILDAQMEERRRQQEAERQAKLRQQQEMDEAIALARKMTRDEQLQALTKAQRERDYREKQQRELDAERERQREEEHNEQLRIVMLNQEELRRQKEAELLRKLHGKEEWKKTLEDNQRKLNEKEQEKEKIKELDRHYQRLYVEAQEKQERERSDAKRRKEERAAYFAKLASGVAQQFQAKEQDQTTKIEAEYQRQLQRAVEDEQERQRRQKQRLQQCLEVQQQQIAERKRKEEEEKNEARRYAQNLRKQAQETLAAEEARKHAARQEAMRTKDFLSTQLQLSYYKETRPLETSIARPPSVAATMYSPSRYTASATPSTMV